MTRYIDADALFINLDGMMAVSPTGYIHGDTVADMISDAPTVDAVPVRHAKWIYGEDCVAMCDGYRCSNCGFFVPWDYQHKFISYIEEYNYCPNCGARMVEE